MNERMASSRGYFGIGVEGVSKPMNVGNLFRTAHAFGASFVFTVNAHYTVRQAKSDTSLTPANLPYYDWENAGAMVLPERCALIGIELVDDAVDLPSFRHPRCAAYVLGRERGSLSPEMLDTCKFVVRIPTRFSLNVATAGAIVMYDRLITLGRFAERPVTPHAAPIPPKPHVFGAPKGHERAAGK